MQFKSKKNAVTELSLAKNNVTFAYKVLQIIRASRPPCHVKVVVSERRGYK